MIRKLLIGLFLALLACTAILGWSYYGAISSVPVNEKVVALTYDDGPNPPDTANLLDVLEKNGVRATFFPKGRNVEAFPDELRAVAAAGHQIGNHSMHHRAMTALGKTEMLEELLQANHLIANITGAQPKLFRPPFGVQGIGLKRALGELDMTSVLVSAAGADWERIDARDIAESILESVEPGGIILLHDGHGDIDDPRAQDSRAQSIAATQLIIEALKSQGYRFVTIEELLRLRIP